MVSLVNFHKAFKEKIVPSLHKIFPKKLKRKNTSQFILKTSITHTAKPDKEITKNYNRQTFLMHTDAKL